MTLSTEPVAQEIAAFVRTRFEVSSDDDRFGPDVHLWRGGYVTSLGVAELIAFIEGRFAIMIPPETLFDERATTINGLASIVRELGGAVA